MIRVSIWFLPMVIEGGICIFLKAEVHHWTMYFYFYCRNVLSLIFYSEQVLLYFHGPMSLTIRFVPIDASHKQVSNLEKWCVWPSKKRWIERLFYSVIKLFWMTWLLVGCAAIHKSWSSEKKPPVRHDINPKFTPYCICFERPYLLSSF